MSEDFSDDYVAELLKKDAKAKNNDYAFVGLSAFRPSKPASNAPKPNTRFLRNIIRDTDSHNAALKEKEEAEARARLRALRKGAGGSTKERSDRPLKAERKLYEPPSKRRKVERSARDSQPEREELSHVDERYRHDKSGREKGGEANHSRHKSHPDSADERRDDDAHGRHRKERPRDSHSVRKVSADEDLRRSSKPTSDHRRQHKRRKSRLPSMERYRPQEPIQAHRKGHRRRRSRLAEDSTSESERSKSSLGPSPAPAPIKRGRGAHNSSSAMDARFDESYDPSTDVQPEIQLHKDDWDEAVEAFRDRARWKALGAERLRSAGFSEAEISKWESSGREKGEEDVVWTKKGEGREWDRGKVVDGSGDTTLQASWAG